MPNVVFMDGFDVYDEELTNTNRPGLHSKWVVPRQESITFPAGRYGGRCIHFGEDIFGNVAQCFFNNNQYLQSATIAFAYLTNKVSDAEAHNQFLNLLHDQEDQFGLMVSNIGQVRLYRGDTMVASTSPNLIKTNAWHFMELEYVGHASTGRTTLYVDGAKVVQFTGNTQNLAPYAFNGLQFRGGTSSGYLIDDLYVTDTAARFGERRIETLLPNGDVSGGQFTPSSGSTAFSMIDDNLVSASDYVSATALGSKSLFNLSNLSTNPDKIDAVQLNVWATKTDAATRQLQTIVKSGSVETNSPDYNLPTNHICLNRIENADPSTGLAWTATGVNALQAGFKISQ